MVYGLFVRINGDWHFKAIVTAEWVEAHREALDVLFDGDWTCPPLPE